MRTWEGLVHTAHCTQQHWRKAVLTAIPVFLQQLSKGFANIYVNKRGMGTSLFFTELLS
jgi:hypothetical protein